ncbi:MAG: urease accessory protein UreD [Jaaginema sp. PMC 1079.18]|nr:urease accessory protein UreD [Jaaginema sp. PMC 1080.18]MEC4851253.1 urease accessory protein UreD [Jaaginema sp. PMC 1079.18]MEC4866416.1 urease accessory protein UreD [Jaaginema sp. PMC 1078.18]
MKNALPSITSPWQGSLDLAFRQQQNQTRLYRTYAKAPLKFQRPFYPEHPTICHAVTLHTAGGIVGGDRLTQNITLDPHSHALITNAAATKVYRSNNQVATQNIAINLKDAAILEWLPQETIIFNEAQYQQNTRIDLAPTASFIGWEIVRLGRSARGEKFVGGRLDQNLEIWQGDRPLWIDRLGLPGNERIWYSENGLAGNPTIASLVCFSPLIVPEIISQLRQCTPPETAQAGITQTQASGLVCRYRGHSTTEARQWLMQIWQQLRLSLWEIPLCVPRVWQWCS